MPQDGSRFKTTTEESPALFKEAGLKARQKTFLEMAKQAQRFPLSADVGNPHGTAALIRADLSVQGMPVPLQGRGETTDFSTTAEHTVPFCSYELVCWFVYLRYNSQNSYIRR